MKSLTHAFVLSILLALLGACAPPGGTDQDADQPTEAPATAPGATDGGDTEGGGLDDY